MPYETGEKYLRCDRCGTHHLFELDDKGQIVSGSLKER